MGLSIKNIGFADFFADRIDIVVIKRVNCIPSIKILASVVPEKKQRQTFFFQSKSRNDVGPWSLAILQATMSVICPVDKKNLRSGRQAALPS